MFLKKYQSHINNLDISSGMDMSLLPPCRSALEMHVGRVSYQVFVWIHSHENNPDLPNLDKSGWKIDGDEIEQDWVKDNLIVPAHLIDILYDQNNAGEADQDLDDDDNDEGVDLTNMVDEVFEDEYDENW